MNLCRRISGLLLAACCVAGLMSKPALAAEPVSQFLEGLRSRQLYDVANMYLDSLRNNTKLPADVKAIIPYEQGRTLIEASRLERDLNTRLKVLAQARERLQEFVTKNSQHELTGLAQLQLGNVMVEEAQVYFEKSKSPAPGEKKEDLLKKSRDLFAQAIKTLENAANEFQAKWKAFPNFIDPKEVAQIQARQQAQANYIQALLYGGVAVQTSAKTWPKNSKEYKDTMNQAVQRFQKVVADFRMQYAGRYAMMLEGSCHQDLGDIRRALGLYREVLDAPGDAPLFQVLKARTLKLALECYLDPSQKMYEEVVRLGEEWLRGARADLERSPEGIAIRHYTALAYHEMKVRDENSTEAARKNEVARYPSQIVKHAKAVASIHSEFQQQAKELLARYAKLEENALPATFAEARDYGKQALDAYQARSQELAAEQAKGAKADKAKVEELTEQRDQALSNALRLLNLAVTLRDEQTTIDDVNVVRYYLAFLYYSAGLYHEAALMGEFLADKYPKSAGARHGAKIAMVGHLANYNTANTENREWHAQQMIRVANLITKNWPGEPEADEAWMLLGQIATREKDLKKAAEYYANIKDDSPRKADADLQAGQALWTQYLTSRAQEPKPPQEELNNLKKEAETRLKAGVDAMRKRQNLKVNYDLLAAELSLAQIYVDDGRAAPALTVLEVKNGVKELLQKNDPVIKTNPRFPTQGYVTLLRAYVAAQKMKEADEAMAALEGLSKSDSNLNLSDIYMQLGREIEQQIKNETDQQKVNQLTKAFGAFLNRVASSPQGASFNNLGWVAEMLFSMGSGIDRPGTKNPEAENYYKQAKAAYEKLLAMPADQKPPQADMGIKVRLAKCMRRLGEYQPAVNQLIQILTENVNLLEAQMEAAYTFQEWGDNVDPKYYRYAIAGWRDRSGNQIVWGWAYLANVVQRQADLKDTYYEARFNISDCRLKEASKAKTPDEKKQILSTAKAEISLMQRLDPKMGGDTWYAKFDQLLKAVQSALREQPTGLRGLEQNSPQVQAASRS